jgi:hypothetical protein
MSGDDKKVVMFPGASNKDALKKIDPDDVLRGAVGKGLKNLVVLGYEPNGGALYVASANGDVAADVFLLEQAKLRYVSGDYNGETVSSDGEDDGA